MKKSYIYMLVPAGGVIVFSLFYIPFARHYDELQVAKHKQELAIIQKKAEADAEARVLASNEANKNAELRRIERERKAAREKEEENTLNTAEAAEVKAHNDKQKNEEEVADLQKQIKLEQTAIAAVEHDKEDTLKEQNFLKTYIQQAEANRQNIHSLLEKLAAAEKARADEAARKAAASNS